MIMLILTSVLLVDAKIGLQLSYIDSQLIDIVWCDQQNVLVLSSKGTIYRSQDQGQEWIKMSETFNKKGMVLLNKDEKVGVVNKIQKHPTNSRLVIFLGTEYINWISGDCGQNVNAIHTGRQMREFQFHHTENWILASSWSKCQQNNCDVTKDLMLSQDMGQSWNIIARYINQFSWGSKQPTNEVPQERILISYDPNGSGHQQLSGWSMKTHLFYSDDFMKTKTMMVNQGNKFQLTTKFIYVAQVMNQANQQVTLLVSEIYNYNFRYAQLPEMLKDHSYTILDTKYSTFININHLKPNSIMGTTYVSDSTGTRFKISLNHTVRTEEGQCDFERVQGLDGIYIANVYSQEQAELYQSEIEVGEQTKKIDLGKFKQSRITFDNGVRWQQLQPPVKDSEGKPIICDPLNCALHLHSISTKLQYGPFYSTKTSVGIIIGTGNVGKYLSYRTDLINTYMSRDGGLTWLELDKGSHIYDIGDHGGIIVMASDQQQTKIIKYSYNEGQSLQGLEISYSPIEISNIITEPSNTAERFIIYGQIQNEETQGVILSVDFSNLHSRQCVGADKPGTEFSDYEYWNPNGKVNPNCLMGRQVNYVRRKREAECINKEDQVIENFVQNCECTEEDWECDINYYRENFEPYGKCIPYELYQQDINPPKICENYYEVSIGYRRVSGNQCQGGIEYHPIKLQCPNFTWRLQSLWDYILVIIFVLIVIFILKKQKLQTQNKPIRAYAQQLGQSEYDEDLIERNL